MIRNLSIVVLLAAVLGGTACRRNPMEPSNGVTAEIESTQVEVPSGSVVGGDGQQYNNITVTVRVSTDLPDHETITVMWCPSKERDVLTQGCGGSTQTNVSTLRMKNPLQLRGGLTPSESVVTQYIHVFVIRGSVPRFFPGTPVSSFLNVLDYQVFDWELTWLPQYSVR